MNSGLFCYFYSDKKYIGMIEINKDKVEVRYITGINKCLPDYPTPLDILYDSCMESPDSNLFSEAKMMNRYGLDEEKVAKILDILTDLEYIKKNSTRFKIVKTPWQD